MLIISIILTVIIGLTVIAYLITSHPLVELKSQEVEHLNPQSTAHNHHHSSSDPSHHPVDDTTTIPSHLTEQPAPIQEFFKSENTQILAGVSETSTHQTDSNHQPQPDN